MQHHLAQGMQKDNDAMIAIRQKELALLTFIIAAGTCWI